MFGGVEDRSDKMRRELKENRLEEGDANPVIGLTIILLVVGVAVYFAFFSKI